CWRIPPSCLWPSRRWSPTPGATACLPSHVPTYGILVAFLSPQEHLCRRGPVHHTTPRRRARTRFCRPRLAASHLHRYLPAHPEIRLTHAPVSRLHCPVVPDAA